MRTDVKCRNCGKTRDHFAELKEHSCAVDLVVDDNCPYCLELAKKKPKSKEVIIQCAKCDNTRMVAVLWDSDEKPVICIEPFCSKCKEKEEEKKFDRDMGVVGPAHIKCAACGRLNMPPNNLGVVIATEGVYSGCKCGAQVKLIQTRKQNVWETEVFEVEKVTPAEGDWIEVTDCVTDNGFNTRISAGSRNTEIDGVEAFPRRGRVKIHWKYWRYVGEKKWRD